MQQEEKKKQPLTQEPQPVPPSETIANAHASGDGALERDKDTILGEGEAEKNQSSGDAAY